MRRRHSRSFTALFIATLLTLTAGFCPATAHAEDQDKPLDDAALKTMVKSLGYEFKEGKFSTGNAFYVITYPHAGSKYYVTISGGGHDFIWVVLDMAIAKPEVELPREVALSMLDKNFDAKRVFFSYDRETRLLRLKAGLANRGVTPLALRSVIHEGVEMCRANPDICVFEKWPKPKSAAPPQPESAAPAPGK